MSEIDVSMCHFYYKSDYFNCSGYKGVCTDHPNCYYKQLQQLKQENEESQDSLGLANKYVNEYKATLDEIEKIAKDKLNEGCSIRNKDCDFSCNKCLFESLNEILQLIKQTKEGEE